VSKRPVLRRPVGPTRRVSRFLLSTSGAAVHHHRGTRPAAAPVFRHSPGFQLSRPLCRHRPILLDTGAAEEYRDHGMDIRDASPTAEKPRRPAGPAESGVLRASQPASGGRQWREVRGAAGTYRCRSAPNSPAPESLKPPLPDQRAVAAAKSVTLSPMARGGTVSLPLPVNPPRATGPWSLSWFSLPSQAPRQRAAPGAPRRAPR